MPAIQPAMLTALKTLLNERYAPHLPPLLGRAKGQGTITVSRNEIIYGLNQADKFILAIVIVDSDAHEGPYYIRNPFSVEPDFGVASINYDLSELLSKAVAPEQSL